MSAATRRAHGSAPVPPARGPSPLLWPPLFVLSLLYRLAVLLRTAAYARGWLKPHRAACPVISVGNLAIGGSGKTPLVEYLLRESLRAGKQPVCLTRGYRGHSRAALMRVRVSEGLPADPVALGDEPAMLARRNPDVTLYVGRARRSAARLALGLGAVATAAGLTSGCVPGAASSSGTDLIVVNGNVLTQDDANPTAEAFAIERGRFVAVGSSASCVPSSVRRRETYGTPRSGYHLESGER